ncbi:MAG: ribosome maturation factor RimM [Phenylobacterium sp.]|jgi:16S rRNA processing protein RimM|uniref:ribosome maturation factor RimM n=1 Tax=Phenylobacterium sp. TaxID=1871053 RepID=UPI002A33910A|nr:ribosome maturation factor RimM [Phenylobacterium sp.]MDD3837297.1 ribosome maturation factor RimM [Phenylobacterium sp.]MDX9996962.1 ribosome maturation factor RimM [Phenylobacterium sp.]
MAERLILVGRVAGAFGVKGEVRITTYTEDPMALVRYRVLLHEDGGTALTLTGARPVKGGIVARAEEVETREAAEALRGLRLHVPRAALPPPEDEDEFYLADLIGLSAETAEGEPLGRIKSVQDFGAGDLLEIQPPQGASWWLPFTREAVPEVRLADGKIIAIRPEETE